MAPAERQIGRYELREQLGRGGTGTVYLAWDTALGRQVALKLLRFPSFSDPTELDRQHRSFRREARTAGRLSHPNVVTIYDTGQDPESGAFYIAMEYIRGTDLRTLLRDQGPLDLPRVANLVGRIAEALDYLHAKGIVHRDIKPANILLDADGQVKLTDFGIALLNDPEVTHEMAVLGTPTYIAPEQMKGRAVDHRVDVFALGVLIHEVLTGEPPFRGDSVAEVVRRVLDEPFDPDTGRLATLPRGVREVISRALEKRPAHRYSSAGDLAAALRAAILEHRQELPTDERMATLELAPVRRRRRQPWLAVRRWRSALRHRVADRHPWLLRMADRVTRRVQPRRVLAAAAVGTLVLLGLYGFAQQQLVAAAEGFAPVSGPSPQYWTLIDEANHRLEADDPRAAAYFLELAGRLAPERLWEVRRLQAEVEARIAAVEATDERREAEEPSGGDLATLHTWDVLASAREVLMLETPEPEAQAFVAEIEAALARRGGAPTSDRHQSTPPQDPSPIDSPPLPRPTGPASLTLEFVSEQPEGILVAYVDDREILRRSFSFSRRSGLFARESQGGSFSETLEAEAGERELRLSLLRPGEAPVVRTLSLTLDPGEEAVVEVRLGADGEVTTTRADRGSPAAASSRTHELPAAR